MQEETNEVKIVPTVGRMVYFNTRGSNDGVYPSRPLAAVITRVYTDTKISLCAFRETGINNELEVEQGFVPGTWDWMPFQKDQQKRMAENTMNESHPKPTEEKE